MWLRRLSPLLALVVALTACGGGGDEQAPITVGPGAEDPQEAVRLLAQHLETPDFIAAADLAVPGQAALAALAEAATFEEVAEALRTGDGNVTANFWSGFAQGSGAFLSPEIETRTGSLVTRDGVELLTVFAVSSSGEERTLFVRDVDGYRIDLFASFGSGLAGRMLQPVERLLSSSSDDAAVILEELQAIVPSLLVAANQPGLPGGSVQELIRLVELITRVS